MTTTIGQQHTEGAYTIRRVSVRRVDLFVGATLVKRDISQAAAFAVGFADCFEFQAVFVGV